MSESSSSPWSIAARRTDCWPFIGGHSDIDRRGPRVKVVATLGGNMMSAFLMTTLQTCTWCTRLSGTTMITAYDQAQGDSIMIGQATSMEVDRSTDHDKSSLIPPPDRPEEGPAWLWPA